MQHAQPWWLSTAFYMYFLAWLPFAAFVVLYWTRSPWRSTAVGRGVMTLAVSITALLTFVLVVLTVPIPQELRDLIRGVLMSGLTLAGWLMIRNLWVEQRRGRDREDAR